MRENKPMPQKQPLILITNDDGITSPGIKALVNAVKDLGRVVVVAPDAPQSAMSHAISVHNSLRYKKSSEHGEIEAYACSGTTTDCVKLAIYSILSRMPDMILSGINHGSNASINVHYSGTMAAAVEGALEGIPSIGFSTLEHSHQANIEAAPVIARKVVLETLEHPLPKHTCLNVNIPTIPLEDIKGIKICRQGYAHWEDEFIEREDPHGHKYYWMQGSFKTQDEVEGTDLWALANDYVSVVPTQIDLTDHASIDTLKTWNLE